MKKTLFTLLFSFILAQLTNAQCASDAYMKEISGDQKSLLEAQDQFFDETSREITGTDKAYKKGTVRIIPVVFHVIHTYGDENITKDQIMDQMRVLNEDFRRLNKDTVNTRAAFKARCADSEIEFRLARIDPNGNCTEGITRTYSTLTDGGDDEVKDLIRWDYRKYLNIWVIKRIDRDADGSGIVLGYATLPFATSASKDGIVIISSRVGTIGTSSLGNAGRTLTHEVGHWLGLLHPFQDGCGSNCSSTGDRVCDTPPVSDPSFGCPTSNNTCNNDSPNEVDMVENYMDYANGTCANAFTKGQISVMNSALSSNTYRGQNVSTTTMTATGVLTNPKCGPKSDFHVVGRKTILCQGGNLTFEDLAYNGTVTDRTWTFEGGSPSVSTLQAPTVTYNSPGTYKVTYEVKNADGTNSLTKTNFITVLPAVADIKTPYTEGMENATLFAEDWTIGEIETYGWKRITTKAYSGTACLQAFINSGTTSNSRYNIYSPLIDMSTLGISNPIFSFKAAYSQADATKSELLVLHASVDCGNTWKSVAGYRSNTGLTSVSGINLDWSPSNATQWKTQTADLSAYATTKNLMLRFEVVSQSGNSIFIDDINIGKYATGIVDYRTEEFDVYPNPSFGTFTIKMQMPDKQNVDLKIFDMYGRLIQHYSPGQIEKDTISVETPGPGVYYLQAENGNFGATRKVLVLKQP